MNPTMKAYKSILHRLRIYHFRGNEKKKNRTKDKCSQLINLKIKMIKKINK